MKNMKLSTRLFVGFGIILGLMLIIVTVVIVSLTGISASVDKIVDVNEYKLELCTEMAQYNLQVVSNLKEFLLQKDISKRNDIEKEIADLRTKYNESWQKLLKTPTTETGAQLREKIEDLMNQARPLNSKVIELTKAGKTQEAINLFVNSANPVDEACIEAIQKGQDLQLTGNTNEASATKTTNNITMIVVVVLGIVSLIFGILLAFFNTKSITSTINGIVINLTEGAYQVTSASAQLSATSQQLAAGNVQQASSIEETSSALEESASMVKQNSENTKQAALLAAQTKNSSDKGNSDMNDMMNSMSEIKKSSDQIAKIIKVIDDIAFQTNILALNAAVEAARAGDAGMGFAVVAEEVRNLAQRSAQAAKDTASIIESNIALSENGVLVAKKVGDSLSEIAVQAKKVNELLDEVAAASHEQSQGIVQINKAISQMEAVTQQNAANAEESAAASEELNAQADSLRDIVNQLVVLVKGKIDEATAVHGSANSRNKNISAMKAHRTSPSAISVRPDSKISRVPNEKKRTFIIDPEDVIPLNEDSAEF